MEGYKGHARRVTRRRILNSIGAGAAVTAFPYEVTASTKQAVDKSADSDTPWPMEDADSRGTSSAPANETPTAEEITLEWRMDVKIPGEGFLPILSSQGLIVGSSRPDLSITSIAVESGKQQWTIDKTGYTKAPVVARDGLHVLHDSKLSHLNSDTGKTRKQFKIPDGPTGFSDLIATEEFLAFTAQSGTIGVIRRDEYAEQWSVTLPKYESPVQLAATSDTLYIGTARRAADGCNRDGRLIAYDLTTGDRHWSAILPERVSEIAVTSTAVVIGLSGSISGFDPETGRRLWLSDIRAGNPSIAIEGSSIIVGDYRSVARLNPVSGAKMWKQRFDSDYISPAVSGSTVYVAGSGRDGTNWDAQIQFINIGDGARRAGYPLNEGRVYGPVLGHKGLFVYGESGTVYRFNGGDN
jgi:outer membrane protein assembly factor BamB